LATLPHSNVGWVQELKSLVIKPVNKFCGPGGDSRVRERPNVRVHIKVSKKKGRYKRVQLGRK